MQQIWKFVLHNCNNIFEIPRGAVLRHVGCDPSTGAPAIWMQVDTRAEKELCKFGYIGTGWEIPLFQHEFIGTAVCDVFVWHVYSAK